MNLCSRLSHLNDSPGLSRRDFLRGSTALLAGCSVVGGCSRLWQPRVALEPIRPCGPASEYVPTIKAAFVRRKEDYGMWWPGAVYDGDAARRKYTAQLVKTAETLGVKLDLRPQPVYSLEEADAWLTEARVTGRDTAGPPPTKPPSPASPPLFFLRSAPRSLPIQCCSRKSPAALSIQPTISARPLTE
jgi:hypothetical protein